MINFVFCLGLFVLWQVGEFEGARQVLVTWLWFFSAVMVLIGLVDVFSPTRGEVHRSSRARRSLIFAGMVIFFAMTWVSHMWVGLAFFLASFTYSALSTGKP